MNDSILKILSKGDKKNIYKTLDLLNKPQIDSIKDTLDDAYHNGIKPLISDKQYDIFIEYTIEKYPNNKLSIGSKIRDGVKKVKLPHYMGSLDKRKEAKQINKWIDTYNGPYIISEKLDGISLLIHVDDQNVINLYTRGDGIYGSDLSYLQNYLNLPKIKGPLTVRGELIVSADSYTRYSKSYDNPRQMVAGIVNSNILKNGVECIDFIAHQIIDCDIYLEQQYTILQKLGFKIPKFLISDKLSYEILSKLLPDMKTSSKYAIDGLVVSTDKSHKNIDGQNPKNAWAFKMTGKDYEAVVEEVVWNISKSGILKPTIKIKPVIMEDVTVSSVTGFNGKYILENSIGKSTKLKIIRSGDVIPHITEILESSSEPDMPTEYEYKWSESMVDLIVDTKKEEYKDEYNIKYLTTVCSNLKIANLGKSTVEKIYKNGWDSLYKILDCKPDSFKNIPSMGIKSSNRIYDSIQESINGITPQRFISATCSLGHGISDKKVDAIFENYPDFFKKVYTTKECHNMLRKIKGFSDITINKICGNIANTIKLLKEHSKFITKDKETTKPQDKIKTHTLLNSRFLFTGFRDIDLEKIIQENGGVILNSYTKTITHLLIPSSSYSNSKVQKAIDDNIVILTREELLSQL